MTVQKKRTIPLIHIAHHGILIISSFLVLLPFLWMISISFSATGDVLDRFLILFPAKFGVDGFREVFDLVPYERWFFNSVFVSTVLTTMQLILGVFAAFALSRFRFRGREVLFFFVLCTMMIPPQAIMLPAFMVINSFGLVNTYPGLMLPHMAHGYVIFMLRQFFLQVPKDLDESSQIDGANSLQTLYHVYLSSALPAVISVTLIQLVRNWNDYYWALVVLSEEIKLTLPVGIVSFRDDTLVRWVPTMASAFMSVIPVIILYLIGQKYFLESNLGSGMK